MNWKIAFFIWLTGLAIFGIICAVTLIGMFVFPYVVGVSLVAIPVYACSLWLLKNTGTSHMVAMGMMLCLPTLLSVHAALYCYKQYGSNRDDWDLNGLEFWVPLLCCILAVAFSANNIKEYLYGEKPIEEMITE